MPYHSNYLLLEHAHTTITPTIVAAAKWPSTVQTTPQVWQCHKNDPIAIIGTTKQHDFSRVFILTPFPPAVSKETNAGAGHKKAAASVIPRRESYHLFRHIHVFRPPPVSAFNFHFSIYGLANNACPYSGLRDTGAFFIALPWCTGRSNSLQHLQCRELSLNGRGRSRTCVDSKR